MSKLLDFYSSFLQLGRETFEQEQFMTAYHALSGAAYCALELRDKAKVLEVRQLALEHLAQLQALFPPSSGITDSVAVTLYESLLRIADTHHVSTFQPKG